MRAYGRRIRNNTTSAGYLSWTDDFAQLSFKDVSFNIARFRIFLQIEMQLLRKDLRRLSLVNPAAEIPVFDLDQLSDNAANQENEWSFLQAENLQEWKRYLLERVLDCSDLQRQFFQDRPRKSQLPKDYRWDIVRVQSYIKDERQFLTRLGLLVYIFGGQPPRGTELFSIRFRNTVSGGARNLYIDHGLVSFVSTYHKGYSIDGSLKLIHRYLTPELSQILVQYLVLIRPFVEQLNNLVFCQSVDSSFLWAKKETTWDTTQLSDFFAAESIRELGPDSRLTVSSWRHIAIAISREFLPKGESFDREGDKESIAIIDQQAGHSDITAATTYGRLVDEGHGQIRQFRERYRRITKRWQGFWLDTPVNIPVTQLTDWPIDPSVECQIEGQSDPIPDLLGSTLPDLSGSPLLSELPSDPLPRQYPTSPQRSPLRLSSMGEGTLSPRKESDRQGISPIVLRQQELFQLFLIQQQEVQGQQQQFQIQQLMQLIQPDNKRYASRIESEDKHTSKRRRR